MNASSRYWDSPTAGMTPDLAAIARKNLTATDRSIGDFNQRAANFSTPTGPVAPAPVPTASGFQFGLNGTTDSAQLSLSGIPSTTNAVNRITPPPSPAQNGDWRLQGFQSQLTPAHVQDKAYSVSPQAYHQISSAPPEHREQYGWGQ